MAAIVSRGDTFVFKGIPGQEDSYNPDRVMSITNITVNGMVEFTINMINPQFTDALNRPAGIHQVSYPVLKELIKDGIWVEEND